MKVYVLTVGFYSDRGIEGIFLDEQSALNYKMDHKDPERDDWEIEEFEVTDKYERQFFDEIYCVYVNPDFSVRGGPYPSAMCEEPRAWLSQPWSEDPIPYLCVYCKANDKESAVRRAISIAVDFKHNHEWESLSYKKLLEVI